MRILGHIFFAIVDISIIWHVCFGQAENTGQSLAFFPLLLTAAFGIFTAVSQKLAADQQADMVEEQGRIAQEQANSNAQIAREEAEAEAQAQQKEVANLRDDQRRRRAAIESMYAKSGVLLEGTPAEVLALQRKTDEYNVRNVETEISDRKSSRLWQVENDLVNAANNQQVMSARAKMYRKQGNTALVAGIGESASNVYSMQKQNKYKTWKWF